MSARTWVSVITAVLLGLIIWAAWPEIVAAYKLLGQVNLWVLSLMIPFQILTYVATGEMIFSYLRFKGHLHHLSVFQTTRMALELNFVNHALPSGGVAGFSYLGWLLKHHDVRPGRSTMAQFVRFAMTFVAFVLLLIISLIILIVDQAIDRKVLLLSLLMAIMAVSILIGGVYLLSSHARLRSFSKWLTKVVNKFLARFSRKQKKQIQKSTLDRYFDEIYRDFDEMMKNRKILIKPFFWSIVALLGEVALIFVAFLSFGAVVNPALLFVALGLALSVSLIVVTPGGAGFYEAIMIGLLAASGVPPDIAIAGTLLARVLMVSFAIVFGYLFYQLTILKYGKRTA